MQPTLIELQKLYEAAIAFKKLECWNWMDDTDLFGVQNPETGEIGYCCVLGALGEVFALNVYLGSEGLEGMYRIQEGSIETDKLLYIQKCLQASFENRDALEQRDRNEIKQLGLKFRGANAWPMFRSYEPGFFPWFLQADQVRFLTVALEQACHMAVRVKENPFLLQPPNKGMYLVRVQREDGTWEDEWLKPDPIPVKPPVKVKYQDELHLKRISDAVQRKLGAWEVDCFFAPFPIRDKERPYYPRMTMWIDRDTGYVYGFHILKGRDNLEEFIQHFLQLIEKSGGKPQRIFVSNMETYDLFELTAKALKIKIERVPVLFRLEEAKQGMLESMMG
ncbi:MAG: hypothetical protein H0Z34_16105 [Brevibacillus sp.]|nr:hypothetical protein [Brevibacillus sp.]